LPAHEQEVRYPRHVLESDRLPEILLGRRRLLKHPQDEPRFERALHVVLQRTMAPQRRRAEGGRDAIVPRDAFEVAIDRVMLRTPSLAAYPVGYRRGKAGVRDAHAQRPA